MIHNLEAEQSVIAAVLLDNDCLESFTRLKPSHVYAPAHRIIYEAICYLMTFFLCMWLYFKKDAWKKEGLIFGIFMICIFGSRFFIELVKNDQEAFEANMTLNMGQWLSIPFVLAGIYCIWRALKNSSIQKI